MEELPKQPQDLAATGEEDDMVASMTPFFTEADFEEMMLPLQRQSSGNKDVLERLPTIESEVLATLENIWLRRVRGQPQVQPMTVLEVLLEVGSSTREQLEAATGQDRRLLDDSLAVLLDGGLVGRERNDDENERYRLCGRLGEYAHAQADSDARSDTAGDDPPGVSETRPAAEIEDVVMTALADDRWEFRSVEGIARATGLDPHTVRDVLARREEDIRTPLVPDSTGNELFTARTKPYTRRERYLYWRAMLSGRLRI